MKDLTFPIPRNPSPDTLKQYELDFKELETMTERNDHTAAALKVARMFGHEPSIKAFHALMLIRDAQGSHTAASMAVYHEWRMKLRTWVETNYPEVYERVHFSL